MRLATLQTARTMADLGEGEWRSMLCLETANAADNAVRLGAGQGHVMRARISVEGGRAPDPSRRT